MFSEPMKESGKQTRERKEKEEGRKMAARSAGGRDRRRGKGRERKGGADGLMFR